MSRLDIITVPDPVLKAVARPVDSVGESVRRTLDAMLETMYDAPGIGLAANQVGILDRILVMDVDYKKEEGRKNPVFMVNPEIVWKSDEISVMEEGCLSIPGQFAEVQRPATVRVRYLDYHGRAAELEAEGLLSHCVQHEIDHLNGVLFIDYLSKLRRDMMIRRVEKLKKQQSEVM